MQIKTSQAMQAVITALAEKHGLDLTRSEAHLRLTMEPYQPLVIEKVGKHLVSVAHYAYQNGDAMSDPDVVFFTNALEWVPIEITQILGYSRAVNLSDDGTQMKTFYPRKQREIATFANQWARNIKAQGWLKNGVKDEDPDDGAIILLPETA